MRPQFPYDRSLAQPPSRYGYMRLHDEWFAQERRTPEHLRETNSLDVAWFF
ncbi:hypothetical protein GT037_010254 [Alternaria burnsii]|uniref:Uncharacterized protein n=1 Tax=Alternaria burnsii TaxID=1187904 RepID=A0A8H7EDB5_9PLEO|nr:uncharacterized protein GT037_010254 [Alternaria burnsii]KAF7671732.1 hypothetical protein GT037_010254 [Alternaria burnsii]